MNDLVVIEMQSMLPNNYLYKGYEVAESFSTFTFKTAGGRYVTMYSKDGLEDIKKELPDRLAMEAKAEKIARTFRNKGINNHIEFNELAEIVLTIVMAGELDRE